MKDSSELARLSPSALAAVERDGLLWISYPKGSSIIETDLSRDVLWGLMLGTGYRPVAQVSIDEVRSALRVRPAELVGSQGIAERRSTQPASPERGRSDECRAERARAAEPQGIVD